MYPLKKQNVFHLKDDEIDKRCLFLFKRILSTFSNYSPAKTIIHSASAYGKVSNNYIHIYSN